MPTTYDLTTDIGKIRLHINDRDVSNATFTDEEIQAFLDSEGTVVGAALAALRVKAVVSSTEVDVTAGDLEVRNSQRSSLLINASKNLEGVASSFVPVSMYAGGISKSDKETRELDDDRSKSFFTRETIRSGHQSSAEEWYREK